MYEESSCFKDCHLNNICGSAMSQKLPVNAFKWVEDISEFDESLIKNCNEEKKFK